jgi:hypothetical protein
VTWLAVQDLDPHLRLRPRPDCGSRLDCDLAAFTLPEFRIGLLSAVGALGIGLIVVLARRRHTSDPAPVLGLLMLVGAAASYWLLDRLLPWLALSVVALAVGGHVAERVDMRLSGRVLAAAPGAVLLASTPALSGLVPAWCRIILGAATALGAPLAAEMDRRHSRSALAPVCLALSVLVVYETVPDTDFVLVLLPLALVLAALAWPVPAARLGTSGTYGVIGLLLFTVVVGGRGRLSAVVGGAACLGLLALEPVARRLAKGASVLDGVPRSAASVVVVAAAQMGIVFVSTRVAGTRLTTLSALLVAGTSTVVFLAALAWAGRHRASRLRVSA